jgi:hypothetical protein
MAQMAEELLLLLLDNATARPGLDAPRRGRVLAAAVLLDLAYACRLRPAVAGDPAAEGRLMALAGGAPVDPLSAPALELVQTRPRRPAVAIKKLAGATEARVLDHLERGGQITRTGRSRRGATFPLTDRRRVGAAREHLLAALFDGARPPPATAGIITVLHAVDGLGALLSLNERGWRWVHARAGEIALGSWVDESPTGLAEVNLAVTAAALRQALIELN